MWIENDREILVLKNSLNPKAFSLIELLVVIAILGILAAIAVPSYKAHIAKTKVANTMTILDDYARKVLAYYDSKGTIPTATQVVPTAVNGFLVSNGAYSGSPIVQNNIASAYSINYIYFTRSSSTTAPGFVFTVQMSNNSTGITELETKEFAYGASLLNGVFKYYCGQWDSGASNSMTTTYLPISCQTVNVKNFIPL